MNKITLVTDSTWDRSREDAHKLGVRVVPLNVHFEEEQFLDGVEINQEQFLDKLTNSKELPTTSQPSPHAFEVVFKEELEKGNKVLYIGVDGELSGTINSANLAKASLESEDIYIVDSKTVAMGLSLLVRIAYDLLQKSDNIDEIVDELNKIKEKIRIYAYVDTLKFLQKGGRLSSTQAIIGGILNVKPILEVKLGVISSFDKARGSKAAIAKLVDLVGEVGLDTNYPVSFAHIQSYDELNNLIDKIKETEDIEDYWIQDIGTVVATHAGPGALGYALVIK